MIAVPGCAALAVLLDSVSCPGLVWSPTVRCLPHQRDMRDNVAGLFWPRLMEVRQLLAKLPPATIQPAKQFISASLCDGEDERSAELAAVLDCPDHLQHRQTWLNIRAKLENIVHRSGLVKRDNRIKKKKIVICAVYYGSRASPSVCPISSGREVSPDRRAGSRSWDRRAGSRT